MRAEYDIADLGPTQFTLPAKSGRVVYIREDVEVPRIIVGCNCCPVGE